MTGFTITTKSNGTFDCDLESPPYAVTRGQRYGATLVFPRTSAGLADYKTARQYLDFAANVSTTQTVNGDVRYRERIPSGAAVGSQALYFDPVNVSRSNTADWWGVVVGGSDEATVPSGNPAISINAVMVVEDTYTSHTNFEADHKISVG